jgi:hypothetical protein
VRARGLPRLNAAFCMGFHRRAKLLQRQSRRSETCDDPAKLGESRLCASAAWRCGLLPAVADTGDSQRRRSLARIDGRAWHAMLGDGRSILTRTVVLASGKYELRGHRRVWKAGSSSLGFKMHWRLPPK